VVPYDRFPTYRRAPMAHTFTAPETTDPRTNARCSAPTSTTPRDLREPDGSTKPNGSGLSTGESAFYHSNSTLQARAAPPMSGQLAEVMGFCLLSGVGRSAGGPRTGSGDPGHPGRVADPAFVH
jgi:hypothetical protein